MGWNDNNRRNGVTVNGDIDVAGFNAVLRLAGVVTLNGTATVSGDAARLLAEGNATRTTTGGGQVVFTGSNGNRRNLGRVGNASLTLGPGLLVHGGYANLGSANFLGGSGGLTNYGTIRAEASGQTMDIVSEINPFI